MNNSRCISQAPLTAVNAERIICSVYLKDVNVGLCFINTATGLVTLTGLLDSQTYVRTIHKLNVHSPTEILIPNFYLSPPNKLISILRANLSNVKLIGLDKKYFNYQNGLNDLSRLSFDKDKNYLVKVLSNQCNIVCSLNSTISFIEKNIKHNFNKLRIKFEQSESTMFIDSSTINNLQLISNDLSLFKFMNFTKTKMGERMLKNNILQPLTDETSISERLQSVNELKMNENLFEFIRDELKNCQDLDKLFSVMLISKKNETFNNQNINQIILVKQAIKISLNIGEKLDLTTSSLLNQIKEILTDDDLIKIKNLINEFINEDCSWAASSLDLKNQKLYAVKSGKNGLLDVSRQLYKIVIDEIINIINDLSEKYNLDLEQSYNSKRGFFIKILNFQDKEIPIEFINKIEKKTYLECTTLDIIKCNSRLDDSVNEILIISNQIIESLLIEISTYLPLLFMISEAISLLDLIQSLSYLALTKNYSCPEFGLNIELKSSRHPIVETLIGDFIPNDIISIKNLTNFQILTGTNMSGKTVYLKQIALISIMSQIGSFLPCESSIIKIFKNLRFYTSNNNESSSSSNFVNEMKEMICILEEINEDSLIIIDELGCGSSINDGYAISLAIIEHLIKFNSTIFISTHFYKLSKVLNIKYNFLQIHMKTEIREDSIKMEYKLTKGLSNSKKYTLLISNKFFNKKIIKRSKEISNFLEFSKKMNKKSEAELLKLKKFNNLVAILKYVYENDRIDQSLLLNIQNEFIN